MTEPLDDNTLLAIDLEQTTGFLLMQVSRYWERSIEEAVSSLDLTKTQFFILGSYIKSRPISPPRPWFTMMSLKARVTFFTFSGISGAVTLGFSLEKETVAANRKNTVSPAKTFLIFIVTVFKLNSR